MIGLPSFHTRVETWECDFNGHWNTRFYLRAFRLSAEVLHDGTAGHDPGAGLHVRFHRELHDGDAVEIRSARIGDGPHAGRVVHFLTSAGRVASTALALDRRAGRHLPEISQADAQNAMPRGIAAESPRLWEQTADDCVAELGLVQPQEVDLQGYLTHEDIIKRVGIASHDYLTRIGFTVDFTRQSGIGRMLVEQRLRHHRTVKAGTRLVMRSRLSDLGRSSFTMSHAMCDMHGELCATIEMCMVAVDMATRRACALPDILLTPACRRAVTQAEVSHV